MSILYRLPFGYHLAPIRSRVSRSETIAGAGNRCRFPKIVLSRNDTEPETALSITTYDSSGKLRSTRLRRGSDWIFARRISRFPYLSPSSNRSAPRRGSRVAHDPVEAFKGTNDRNIWSGASGRATRRRRGRYQRNRDRVNFSNEPN